MIVTGTRVALTAVAIFACVAAGQRITTIQLDGTQYYISRMNPYSAELNYFLAYEYCRSIGLQLASFETLEKTNSISDFLRNAGYNKYDYWTSGNRLGTDMLIWMSTGLPFNTTFNQMKRPNSENNGNGLDTDDLKMNARPELPIARKKRGESGSRDGCVAIKAPNMDWVTADCTDLKDFICEQTRCYYYNYGSIPVSSSQGFGYKQKAPLYSTTVSSEKNTTTPATTTPFASTSIFMTTPTNTPTTTPNTTPTTTPTTTISPPSIISTTTTAGDDHWNNQQSTTVEPASGAPVESEPELTIATTYSPAAVEEHDTTTEPITDFQELQTDEQPSTSERASDDGLLQQYYTTELPTLIQMHNRQQQLHEQQDDEQQQQQQPQDDHQNDRQDENQDDGQEQQQQQQGQRRNNAYAFESLEKAFATAVPHKIRSTKDLEQPKDQEQSKDTAVDQLPWSWAKDIMLQKPVLTKSSKEVV